MPNDIEMLDPVSEIVSDARNGLADAVAAQIEGRSETGILGSCCDYVQNIGMAAELAQLTGLQSVCDAINDQLGLHTEQPGMPDELGYRMVEWVDDVLAYLEEPGDPGLAKKLLAPLPADERQDALLQVLTDEAQSAEGGEPMVSGDSAAETGESADVAACAADDPDDITGTLSEVVVGVIDSLSEDVDALSHARVYGTPYPDALDSWLAQLANMSAAAEMCDFEGLHSLCEAVREHLESVAGSPRHDVEEEGMRLLDWTSDVLAYLRCSGDGVHAEKLVAYLPEDRRDGLADALLVPAATDEVEESAPVDAGQFTEAEHWATDSGAEIGVEEYRSADADTGLGPEDTAPTDVGFSCEEFPAEEAEPGGASGILGVFQDELMEVSEELEPLAHRMTDSALPDDTAMEAACQYSSILGRITTASESLGLEGLKDVCAFVDDNVGRLACFESAARAEVLDLLLEWPTVVMSYLNEPTNDANCLATISCLQQAAWPVPLPDSAAQPLLAALAREIVEPDFGEEVEVRETQARPEDVALQISDDVNQELVDAFFHESPGHAENLSERVKRIAAGEDVQDNVGAAQRLAHTLKGSANLVGIKGVANLMHHMEDILDYLSGEQQTRVPEALSYSLQEAADCVETMIDSLQGRDTAPEDAQRILQDVLDWANLVDSGQLEAAQADASVTSKRTDGAAQGEASADEKRKPAGGAQGASQEVLRVSTRTVDDLFRMVGEMSIAIGQIRESLKGVIRQGEEMRVQDRAVQQRRFELEDLVDVRSMSFTQRRMRSVVGGENVFDSLEMDQYDELYGSAHGFIESVSDYREMMQRLQNGLSGLDGLFLQQERLNKELQRVVMTTRMVPVGNIASRLQRSVRQACRATGKQAELHLVGGDLLLDGDVLNKLADPLMHMLRNAVDHGIEFADERQGKGKDVTGRVVLTFQQDGNNMLVRCEDDGHGLDYGRIKDTAVKRGLIDANAVLDPRETARLILTPGFSTRETATHTSGRGVGMDVVNNTVQLLNGSMDIGDGDDAGCRITVRLPITLVTSHAVLVRNGDDLVAIPTSSLAQILAPGTGEFEILGSEVTYKLGKDMYPVRSVAELLGSGGSGQETQDNDSKTVLLVRADEGLVAATIDQVVNSYDLVIKSTGRYVQQVHGVAGVSILGDGSIVPVLNLPELLREHGGNPISQAARTDEAAAVEQTSRVSVLIVDDSLSVRKSLSQLVSDAGYAPTVARDGLEAVDLIDKHKPDIVLADLEMPRMTGLELTSHIRADSNLADLPVIMITSRTMQKHRQQAQKVGVTDYMTKPFSEDDLLGAMESALRVN